MLMRSSRYIAFLEKRIADLEGQVKALTNTVFAVQGAPQPFAQPVPDTEAVHISRKRTDAWLAELSAAEKAD